MLGRALLAVCLVAGAASLIVPTTTGTTPKVKPRIGPRKELNETGKYLFKHPHEAKMLLCRTCSELALSDSSYQHQQEAACIYQNYDADKPNELAPYCNIGKPLGCGAPSANHSNAFWDCNLGYSADSTEMYTVYSTCELMCNHTRDVMARRYCSENLTWYDDQALTSDCIPDPVPPKDPGDKKKPTIVIVVVSCVGVIVVIVGAVRIIVCCLRKQNGKRSQSSSPAPVEKEKKERPETPPSIGFCSLDNDGPEESIPLIEKEPSPVVKVTTATSTPSLYSIGEGSHDGNSGRISTHNQSKDVTYSPEKDDNSQNSQQDRSDERHSPDEGIDTGDSQKTSSPSSSSSSQTEYPIQQEKRLKSSVKSDQSPSASAQSSRSSNLSRTATNHDEPTLAVFTDMSSQSTSVRIGGIDNMRLQLNQYGASEGSPVYFVSSEMGSTLKIERKDDSPPFAGRQWMSCSSLYIDRLSQEDAGLYRWTITYQRHGETLEKQDVIELFVAPARPINSPSIVEHPDEGIVVNGTAEGENGTPTNAVNETPQYDSNTRLPPEGAENDVPQVSGNTNPLYRINPNNYGGARPKVYDKGVVHLSATSGNPSQSVKGDVQRPAIIGGLNSERLNSLNKPVKESVNNLDANYLQRNIRSEPKNVTYSESLENMSLESKGHRTNSSVEHLNCRSFQTDSACAIQSDPTTTHSEFENLSSSNILSCENNEVYDSEKKTNGELSSLPSAPTLNLDTFSSKDDLQEPTAPTLDIDSFSSDKRLSHRSDQTAEPDTNQVLANSDSVELPMIEIPEQQSVAFNSEREVLHERNLNRYNEAKSSARQPSPQQFGLSQQVVGDAVREDPTGMVEAIEHHSDDEETEAKSVYNNNKDVRAERVDNSHFQTNQPLAHARVLDTVPSSGPRPVSPIVAGVRNDARREADISEEGAVGPLPNLEGGMRRCINNEGPSTCITLLKYLTDSNCIKNVCHHANPREPNGDDLSWFGLCLYYNVPLHECKAIAYALRPQVNQGPMHYVMTELFVSRHYRVGHIVYYFTRPSSTHREIADLLVKECRDHRECKYCLDLLHKSDNGFA